MLGSSYTGLAHLWWLRGGLWSQMAWVFIPTLSLINCLTLAKVSYISSLQFPVLQNGDNGDPSNGVIGKIQ